MGLQMIFDWHISVGNIIEIIAILSGGLLFLWGMKARVDLMADELQSLKKEISKLADILTKLAVYDQRFLNVEKDIDEMRHGIGFIVKPSIAG